MKTMPTVSVIIPTFRRSRILPRAVRSVLEQTYPHLEVVVVDDRSPDDTHDVVKHMQQQDSRVRYLLNEGIKGCSGAKNAGITAARGGHIAFLDDDDAYCPDKIAKQVDVIQQHPNAGCVVSSAPAQWVDGSEAERHWVELEFRPYRLFHPCHVMCRRSMMDGIAFQGDYMEWRDFAFQLYERHVPVILSAERLVRIARDAGAMSRHEMAMLSAALRHAKDYYDRSRGRAEHWVFRQYLANCQKNVANYSLKRGRLWRALRGYADAFRAGRRIRDLIPFVRQDTGG